MKPLSLLSLSALFFLLAACAGPRITPVPNLPKAMQPPADQSLFFEALASGVQVYECKTKPDGSGAFEWVFRAPEAALFDSNNKPLGKHYAGPTWEALDLSNVVGEIKARDPGPDPKAIPWLLLSAKTVTGKGVFSETKSILRVRTAGGVAPTEPCTEAKLKEMVRVPYTASYHYYR
jgi:Protein of unknown function (DUF3455)